mgnify:CR=1 FL=1
MSRGRIRVGPGTLYAMLARFEKNQIIRHGCSAGADPDPKKIFARTGDDPAGYLRAVLYPFLFIKQKHSGREVPSAINVTAMTRSGTPSAWAMRIPGSLWEMASVNSPAIRGLPSRTLPILPYLYRLILMSER